MSNEQWTLSPTAMNGANKNSHKFGTFDIKNKKTKIIKKILLQIKFCSPDIGINCLREMSIKNFGAGAHRSLPDDSKQIGYVYSQERFEGLDFRGLHWFFSYTCTFYVLGICNSNRFIWMGLNLSTKPLLDTLMTRRSRDEVIQENWIAKRRALCVSECNLSTVNYSKNTHID